MWVSVRKAVRGLTGRKEKDARGSWCAEKWSRTRRKPMIAQCLREPALGLGQCQVPGTQGRE